MWNSLAFDFLFIIILFPRQSPFLVVRYLIINRNYCHDLFAINCVFCHVLGMAYRKVPTFLIQCGMPKLYTVTVVADTI